MSICFLLNDSNMLQRDEAQNICSICLGVIGEYNKVVTKCSHQFCLSCLLTSLEKCNNCPLCRSKIENKRPHIYKKITIESTCKYIEEVINDYDVALILYMIKNIPRHGYVNLVVHLRTMMTDLLRKIIIFQYGPTTDDEEDDDEEEDGEDEDDEEEDDEDEDDEAIA